MITKNTLYTWLLSYCSNWFVVLWCDLSRSSDAHSRGEVAKLENFYTTRFYTGWALIWYLVYSSTMPVRVWAAPRNSRVAEKFWHVYHVKNHISVKNCQTVVLAITCRRIECFRRLVTGCSEQRLSCIIWCWNRVVSDHTRSRLWLNSRFLCLPAIVVALAVSLH